MTPDENRDRLVSALGALRARLRTRFWYGRLWLSLVAGAAACLLVAAYSWVVVLETRSLWALASGLAAALSCASAGFFAQPGVKDAIIEGDSAGLNQRLITAYEFSGRTEPLYVAQRNDALQQLARLDVNRAFPVKTPKRQAYVALALAALSAALLLAPYRFQPDIDRLAAFRQEAKKQAEKVRAVREALEKAPAAERLSREQAIKEMKELEQKLKEAKRPEDALNALSLAEARLAKEKSPAAGKKMEEALSAMSDALSKGAGTQEAGSKLGQKDWKGAADEIKKLALRMDKASAEQKAEMSDSLQQAGEAAQAAGQAGASLAGKAGAAAKAVAQGTASEASQALEELAGEIEQTGSEASTARATAQALGAIGAARYGLISSQAGQPAAGAGSGMAAGQGRGSGSGTGSGSGAGQGQGAGSGISRSQGTGGGQSGAGMGSTNQASPTGQEAPNTTQGSGSGNPDGKQGIYERIYAPNRPGGDSQASVVAGRAGSGPSDTIDTGPQAPGRASHRPYSEVFQQFEQHALEAIDRSEVPASMRDYVRRYFSSLEPSGGR